MQPVLLSRQHPRAAAASVESPAAHAPLTVAKGLCKCDAVRVLHCWLKFCGHRTSADCDEHASMIPVEKGAVPAPQQNSPRVHRLKALHFEASENVCAAVELAV